MKLRLSILLSMLAATIVVMAQQFVNFNGNGFHLNADNDVKIYVDKKAPIGVKIAAENLCRDIEAVSGATASIVKKSKSADIRVSVVPDSQNWESYQITADADGIDIVGSDRRGAIYGIYEISEQIGVSPWYWWADVPVVKHPDIYINHGTFTDGNPSIKYRGFFINDEDWCLYPWSKHHFEPEAGTIGPRTYAKVCELILRLKGNMVAPAMHTCTGAFYALEDNKRVADSLGVIITTSHCEPLLLNNAAHSEWDNNRDGDWNYALNAEKIRSKWNARLDEASQYENIYTMAMRGLHDEGLRGNFTPQERVDLITQVIDDQRQMLTNHINKPINDIPQIFVPYKETMDIYENGLQVPDDVTIVWVDDNYGYMKRVSNPEEQKRAGRAGVYYHISYLGCPHEYLWLQSTPPVLMYEELMKAYNTGADRYWLLNVGDIKPGELGISTFFDLAWDVDDLNIQTVNHHQAKMLADIFGSKYQHEFQHILDQYYRLAWEHKPEYMGGEHEWDGREYEKLVDTHHSFETGEAQLRLDQYRALSDKVAALEQRIPQEYRPAFFELISYPVMGAYQMNRKFLMAKLNHELFAQGRNAEANWAAEQSKQAFDSIHALNHRFNTMLDGKWKYFGTITPGIMALYQNMPHLDITEGAGSKAVDLTPVIFDDANRIKLDLADYTTKSDDINLLKGIGYDWIAVQMAEPTGNEGGKITYQLPAGCEGTIDVEIATVPFFPLYKGCKSRVAVSVDGGEPQIIATDFKEYSREWKNQVLVNGAKHKLHFDLDPNSKAHTITFSTIDPGQMLQQVIIND